MSEEEQQNNNNEENEEQNEENKEENQEGEENKEPEPVLDEQEQKDLEEDKAEEERDKEEEQVLDEEGNPIPNAPPKPPQNPLKSELLHNSLSKLSKTFDGLSYAFSKLDIHEKELDGLGEEINNFILLRDFNCSNNKIKDISPLSLMKYITIIEASTNVIKEINMFEVENSFQYLKILNLKQNRIKKLPKMHAVYLEDLNLSENRINDISEFNGLPKLKKLNLNQNKIKSCYGLANCPNLEVLYLNNNRIKSMEGINLERLRKLRLKTNRINSLEFIPFLPCLQKLNISENQIKDRTQFKNLEIYTHLLKINCEANPYFDEAGIAPKTELIIQLPELTKETLKFVNKEQLVKEDFEEAAKTLQERIEK